MFDYIIVGAGSAGCVLANRLAADGQTTVLLLEAGRTDNKLEIRIPAGFPKLFKSDYDWGYATEPQPQLHQRQLYWPRGKVLGGSSSINAMIYIRGNPKDYDHWADLGNAGWGFADLLPYFKKSQHQLRGPSPYHSQGGLLHIADLHQPHELSLAFVRACQAVGLPLNPDFNGPNQSGAGLYQVTQRKRQRESAASAFLRPALKWPNLLVKTEAKVTRLLFDGRRAKGVVYRWQGTNHEVRANREIILCGGAINSPQLLLLSGVGPAGQLQQMGIPVVADLAGVGQNLHDHLLVPVVYHCSRPVSLNRADTLFNLIRYLLFRRGHFTSNLAEAGAFWQILPNSPVPDLQFHFIPAYFLENGFMRPPGDGFTIGATLIYPKSRGYLALRSPDPNTPPLIQPNYGQHSDDLAILVGGIKLARQIANSPPFAPYRSDEYLPGRDTSHDSAILDHIATFAQTLYHPVGSCKMGLDPLAVVSPALKVHGIDGLRVADAAIMPAIISGNTNAPTMMIAEKAADLIRHDKS